MTKKRTKLSHRPIEQSIMMLRGQKVILDSDLANLYGVEVRALNQQIKRNADRFPQDFAFQLTEEEFKHLKSQIVISSHGGLATLPLPSPSTARSWRPQSSIHRVR